MSKAEAHTRTHTHESGSHIQAHVCIRIHETRSLRITRPTYLKIHTPICPLRRCVDIQQKVTFLCAKPYCVCMYMCLTFRLRQQLSGSLYETV